MKLSSASPKPIRTILLVGTIFLLFVGLVIATYHFLTYPYPGLSDFLPRWEGTRSFWLDNLSPYSDETSLNIQLIMYGRPAYPVEDQAYFVYPFYIVFLLLPFIGISYAWASAIWMVILEASMIGGLLLLLEHFQWRPHILMLATLFVWTLAWYFTARGLILGQFGILAYFLQIAVIWALGRKHDRLAGLLLTFSTVKPQMGYLLIPFLVLWAVREKRWQFLFSSGFSMAFLLIASFLMEATWVQGWLGQVGDYSGYTHTAGPMRLIADTLWPVARTDFHIIEFLLAGIFYIYLLWTWFAVLIQRKQERFMWTIVITLTITNIVLPRAATPHYVIFIIPLIFYLHHLTKVFSRTKANLYVFVLLLILLIGSWVHFTLTIDIMNKVEHSSVFIVIPLIFFFVLVLTRNLWWNNSHDRFQTKN